MKGIIYCAESTDTGKCYIGQTICKLTSRRSRHFYEKRGYHFSNALKKYPRDNWNWYIVQEYEADNKKILKDALNKAEEYYIRVYDSYKSGYNSTAGGDGSPCRNHSEETKRKISEAHKGLPAWNRKKCICVETGIVYPSLKHASQASGVLNIKHSIDKSNRTAGGYHWQYC